MIKKYLTVFFLISIIWFVGGSLRTFAETTPIAPEQINARILPLVWYSTLSINDGDSIKIYAGIQNNSGINFTGTATFYVDDREITSSPFTSSDNSLGDISIVWVAGPPGSHDIQVKIVTSLPSDKSLVSYESAKSSIDVIKKITPEVTKNTATNIISNVISKIDEVVVPLVNKIEDLKKPINTDKSIANQSESIDSASQKNNGAVLGISAGLASSSERNNGSKMDFVYNIAIDVLAFLVKNWLWTLGGIILILLIIKIKRRRRK